MKLYRKLIKPVLYCPGQSYEPKKKDLENPVVWYPEEEHDAIWERFKHLNNTFNTVGFDTQYIEYEEESLTVDSFEVDGYFKSEKEMVAWLNEFAAKQLDFEDSMRLAEISVKLHFKAESEKLKKLMHEKLDSSEKCKDCHNMSHFGDHAYCRIEGMSLINSQQDISTIYVDPESKPSWCPIDKTNAALETLSPEQRDKMDTIMKGFSAAFGLDQKAGDNL